MSKSNSFRITITAEADRSMRQSAHARELQQLIRDGVKVRAATFIDRRKEQSRKACRGKNSANW
jgi:hypothetical protein